jgi:hypothetical protein
MMDSADTLADLFYYGGLIISIAAIVAGVSWAVAVFLRSFRPTPAFQPLLTNDEKPLARGPYKRQDDAEFPI